MPKNNWDQEAQKAKPEKDFRDINKRLRETVNFFMDKYDELFPKGISLAKEDVQRKSDVILDAYKIFSGKKTAVETVRISLISFIATFQDRYKNKFNPCSFKAL